MLISCRVHQQNIRLIQRPPTKVPSHEARLCSSWRVKACRICAAAWWLMGNFRCIIGTYKHMGGSYRKTWETPIYKLPCLLPQWWITLRLVKELNSVEHEIGILWKISESHDWNFWKVLSEIYPKVIIWLDIIISMLHVSSSPKNPSLFYIYYIFINFPTPSKASPRVRY